MTRTRGWFRWAMACAAILVVSELAAFAAFALFLEGRLTTHWRVDPEADIARLDGAAIERFRAQFFDAELGWVFKMTTTAIGYTAFDARGARRTSAMPPDAGRRLAAYGDSFTFGESVADGETWPAYLAQMLGLPVDNYGVAGYGPDQALLRFERHLKEGRRPGTVFLGVLSENIARVVNVYRHFYVTTSETMNFKPVLQPIDVRSAWAASPLRTLDRRESLLAAVAAARPNDFWATYNERRPVPGFPFLAAAIDTLHYLAFRAVRWQDLWKMVEPRRRLRAVVHRFAETTGRYGVRPVVLMIPMGDDLRRRNDGKDWSYRELVSKLRDIYGSGSLVVVDPLENDFDPARFHLRPFAGHASPYGNRVLADAVAARLSVVR